MSQRCPVPPIYQPEMAARAIHYAALHPRRELWLGWSSVFAILGQKVAPRLLNHMLAWKAYQGQQTDEPALLRPDNLFHPVPGNYGAHGRFGGQRAHQQLRVLACEAPGPDRGCPSRTLVAVGLAGLAQSGRTPIVEIRAARERRLGVF